MGLTWGHPAMLAGLALLALPLLVHLVGRRAGATVVLPTARLLVDAQRRMRRRWLLSDGALLLARLLLLAALVALAARPSWTHAVAVVPTSLRPVDTVLLLDRSMSTRARLGEETAFARIRDRAVELLTTMEPTTPVAAVWFDDRTAVVGEGWTTDHAALIAAIRDGEPGFAGTDLTAAITRGDELLALRGAANGQVVVLGDGTATDQPGPDGSAQRPPGHELRYVDLGGPPLDNRYVVDAEIVRGALGDPWVGVDLTVGSTTPAAEPRTLDLRVPGREPLRATTPAADEPPVRRFTLVDAPAGLIAAEAVLGPDALPADDRWPLFLRAGQERSVYLLGGAGGADPRDDELYYLRTALRPDQRGGGDSMAPTLIRPEQLASLPAAPGTALMVCNQPSPAGIAGELRRLVEGGAGVLIAVGELVDRDAYNRALADLLPARLGATTEGRGGAFSATSLSLAPPDPSALLWAPFGEGGLSTFTRVRVDRVVETEPPLAADAQVLLRYDDGRSALLERRVGAGRVLLWTTTLDDDWTDLPIRGVYLPMIHQLARWLAGDLADVGGEVFAPGSLVEIPWPSAAQGALELVGPDAARREVAPPRDDAGTVVLTGLERPGHYRLETLGEDGSAGEVLRRFCLRAPPAESALTPIDRAGLAAALPATIYVDADGRAADAGERATAVRTRSLVPALAALALAALGLEGLLRRRT